MLFNYTYITHDMGKMQKYMDYIFYEIWCKATKNKKYKPTLYNRQSDLKRIIKQLLISDSEGADFFLKNVEEIYYIFQTFSLGKKAKIKRWYKINTNIKELCNHKIQANPLDYKKLKVFNEKLHNKLKELYSKLYGTNPITELKEFKPYLKTIDEHYKDFMHINNEELCPFCGIHSIKGIYHTKKEAYDHFLPKGKYPFNTINFKNLAPMCHECNSSYKTQDDPIFDKSLNRRKAFYPYSLDNNNINIKISLLLTDIKPENIDLDVTAIKQNEVNTWLELFGIEERYKALFSGNDGRSWLSQIVDEAPDFFMNSSDYLKIKKKQYLSNPYNEKNFLRVPFLDECSKKGII